ncbi:hypothetical protein MLD38_010728 [Melastoma candidum]|uniref:Uncharacterized protein n=1 Tax=Melastoma candidum TaxID=119954 RepID=A0ACB9R2K8_9MYRT|nr:hypothetical protein MLD38_010728 [Melastoma candidum]
MVASSVMEAIGRRIVSLLPVVCFLFCTCSAVRNPPLFFIFGDSLVDVGNNNFIRSLAKGNFYPHGIDFGRPTGRLTNGRTAFDIVEQVLGSRNFTPPYLDPATTTEAVIQHGANYASSGSGFLNETGEIFGGRIDFHRQIGYHTIARQAIISMIGDTAAKKLLRRAVYVIATGWSNDLLYERATAKQRKLNSPDAFLNYLMSTIRTELTRLHSFDAREMIVTNVGPIGCIPFARDSNPLPSNGCVGRMNARARLCNKRMKEMLVDLSAELKGSKILYADIYAILEDLLKNYQSYGFENADSACCALRGAHGGLTPCGRKSRVCSDRSRHVFWDPFHLTESANRIAVRELLYGGPDYISPINISQLVNSG